MHDIARYYPIVTAIFAFIIAWEMLVHYRARKSPILLCWIVGVCGFGLAALAASLSVLIGWSPVFLKLWYSIGALVGGFPLAQGMVYFLLGRKVALISTILFSIIIATGAVAVALSPILLPAGFDHELTGKVFAWKWVRYFPLLINSYSFLVLLSGGVFSAIRYYSQLFKDPAYLGNANIALGGILPGIGGILMRIGYVNALFVMEFLALVVIYSGYRILKKGTERSDPSLIQ